MFMDVDSPSHSVNSWVFHGFDLLSFQGRSNAAVPGLLSLLSVHLCEHPVHLGEGVPATEELPEDGHRGSFNGGFL